MLQDYDAIPQHFKDNLELHDVILHIADDLWKGNASSQSRYASEASEKAVSVHFSALPFEQSDPPLPKFKNQGKWKQ